MIASSYVPSSPRSLFHVASDILMKVRQTCTNVEQFPSHIDCVNIDNDLALGGR